MTESELCARLRDPVQDGKGGFMAFCPVHADGSKSGRRSLHASPGTNGRPVLFCFAGCSFDAIAAALGLNGAGAEKAARVEEATYNYVDAHGALLFQVLRYREGASKTFRQRAPDGAGGWTWSTKGIQRVPYRLPDVLAAIAAGEPIFVAEGEKCVEALRSIGLVGTCNPGGAGQWRPELSPHFKGARVVVLPDHDEPGRKHAQAVAQSLAGVAADVRILELPGLAGKQDVADWIEAGHTRAELEALVDAAPLWTPATEPEPSGCEVVVNLTDLGNARRFAADHAGRVLFVHPWKSWIVFTGQRWERDTTGHVFRLAQQTVASMYLHAATIPDKGAREALAGHALKSESAKRLKDMLELSRALMPASPDDFDRDPMKLNVANGTLDLTTGTLRPHRPEDRLMHLAQVEFNPEATCPTFDRAMAMWTDTSDALAEYLQRVFGYCLTGKAREDALFLVWGPGQNGKTVLMNTVVHVLGSYAQRIPAESLLARRDGGIPNDIARLKGARLVSAMESEAGRALAEGLVKMLTGGDRIVARFLHAEFFEFMPEFKLFLSTNHRPRIRGTDLAIWRRVRLIPFTVKIPEVDRDRELEEKLKAEAPGILAWMVRGCPQWQQEGLRDPEEVTRATAEYREEQDVLGDFLAECCVVEAGASEGATAVFAAYKRWAEGAGEGRPMGQRAFGLALTERGFGRKADGRDRRIVREGIRLAGSPPLTEGGETIEGCETI